MVSACFLGCLLFVAVAQDVRVLRNIGFIYCLWIVPASQPQLRFSQGAAFQPQTIMSSGVLVWEQDARFRVEAEAGREA